MRPILSLLFPLVLLSTPAVADPWKGESGHERWRGEHHGEYRGRGPRYAYGNDFEEEFWVGNCKIERKWERDGDYEEERKCKSHRD